MQRLQGVKLCRNDDVDGFFCGREPGHEGKHIAFDQGGIVTCEWYPADVSGLIRIEFIREDKKK